MFLLMLQVFSANPGLFSGYPNAEAVHTALQNTRNFLENGGAELVRENSHQ